MILPPHTTHQTATLNGSTYHYLLSLPPSSKPNQAPETVGTIFLLHGWPDLSLGWRNQIEPLRDLNFRIVCPDMIGYGRTCAPSSLSKYSFKTAADDLAALARDLGCEQKGVVVGGHDWGGMIAHRFALHHPDLVKAVFTVCTPYTPPSKAFLPLEEVVKRVKNFGYQAQLASGKVEEAIRTKQDLKAFLNALYGGQKEDGKGGLSITSGVDFSILGELRSTPLMDEEMLDYYAEEYARHGIGPTLNWYRTREINHQDEQYLLKKNPPKMTIECPVLFVQARDDAALPPKMSEGMENWIPRLRRNEVEGSHWALWEQPENVNGFIREWLEQEVISLLKGAEDKTMKSEKLGKRSKI